MQQSMEQSQIMITSPCPKLQLNIFGSLGEKTIPLRSVNPRNCRHHRDDLMIAEKRTSRGEVPKTSLISREELHKFVDFLSTCISTKTVVEVIFQAGCYTFTWPLLFFFLRTITTRNWKFISEKLALRYISAPSFCYWINSPIISIHKCYHG